MVSASIDIRDADAMLKRVIAAEKSFPRKDNPLVHTLTKYKLHLKSELERRPTLDNSGTVLGVNWKGFDAGGKNYLAYVRGSSSGLRGSVTPSMFRKQMAAASTPGALRSLGTSGERVPIWGGVQRKRQGRVTRVRQQRDSEGNLIRTQRRAGGLTPDQKKAGYGAVQLGQTFNTPEVLGKLKSDGTRYKKSDKQMGKIGGGHMLGRFTTATPQISASGKSVAIVANEPYAARQHKRRPWAWTEHIAEWMTKTAVIEVAAYLNRKAKARRAV